jgi:hypothetical protein
LVKLAAHRSRAAAAWTAGPAGIHQLKISHMKNIRAIIFECILIILLYLLIIKPILWIINKYREG